MTDALSPAETTESIEEMTSRLNARTEKLYRRTAFMRSINESLTVPLTVVYAVLLMRSSHILESTALVALLVELWLPKFQSAKATLVRAIAVFAAIAALVLLWYVAPSQDPVQTVTYSINLSDGYSITVPEGP